MRHWATRTLSVAALASWALTASTAAFDLDSSSNLVTYWGQNSYGVTHPGAGGAERSLEEYCQNDSPSDVFVLAFLQIFNAGTNKPPVLDFSDQCKTTFPGSELLRCPSIARGIKTCQAKGKAVLLSLGGAVGLYGFRSNDEGRQFARTIWNMFFAGGLDYPPDGPPSNSQASLRPLGDVILDGIDLDIEGGSPTGYAAFIETLRGYFQADAARKRYYVAAAPQCAFPDFYMQPILEKAWFDMLYIQFYNNYCGLNNPSAYNYQVWHEWAQTKAINKNVKLYVGVPGGPTGASTGFVTMDQLRPVLDDTRAKFDSFGGVMMWDTSQAMNTPGGSFAGGSNFAQATSDYLKNMPQGPSQPQPQPRPRPRPRPRPPTPTPTPLPYPPTPADSGTGVVVPEPKPMPTKPSRSVMCPAPGAPCPVEYKYACSGYDYAQCVFGHWLIRPCHLDRKTACFPNGDGILCDYIGGRDVVACQPNEPVDVFSSINFAESRVRPIPPHHPLSQLHAGTDAVDANAWVNEAMVNPANEVENDEKESEGEEGTGEDDAWDNPGFFTTPEEASSDEVSQSVISLIDTHTPQLAMFPESVARQAVDASIDILKFNVNPRQHRFDMLVRARSNTNYPFSPRWSLLIRLPAGYRVVGTSRGTATQATTGSGLLAVGALDWNRRPSHPHRGGQRSGATVFSLNPEWENDPVEASSFKMPWSQVNFVQIDSDPRVEADLNMVLGVVLQINYEVAAFLDPNPATNGPVSAILLNR